MYTIKHNSNNAADRPSGFDNPLYADASQSATQTASAYADTPAVPQDATSGYMDVPAASGYMDVAPAFDGMDEAEDV